MKNFNVHEGDREHAIHPWKCGKQVGNSRKDAVFSMATDACRGCLFLFAPNIYHTNYIFLERGRAGASVDTLCISHTFKIPKIIKIHVMTSILEPLLGKIKINTKFCLWRVLDTFYAWIACSRSPSWTLNFFAFSHFTTKALDVHFIHIRPHPSRSKHQIIII